MSLKDLTWEHHKDAERQEFVKVMMSGKINPELYAIYLWNQHKKYDLLEAIAGANGVLDDLPGIRRKQEIEKDFFELWTKKEEEPPILPSTEKYIEHMRSIMADPEALMAHIYTLHMGDLSGGQMIKNRIPGTGNMYNFKVDTQELKEAIRNKIHDGMADEAKFCFETATNLFKELMELDIERYMEPAN